VARDGPVPLSFAQERLWSLHRLLPGATFFNTVAVVRFTGALDAGLFEKCLNDVIRRHEILRTTFPERDGHPVADIHAELALKVRVVDLRARTLPEQDAETGAVILSDTRSPFDLNQLPLIRASLVRLSDEEQLAVFTLHHIVSDGWSLHVLFRELELLYAHEGAAQLPELPVQYADFAAWQRRQAQTGMFDAQLAYWSRQLGGDLRRLPLGADAHGIVLRTARESIAIDASTWETVRRLSRSQGATSFMTLIAALDVLLCVATGERDIRIGTLVASRTRSELEPLIGLFVNTVVLRTVVDDRWTSAELLHAVRETALAAYANQDVPFEEVVRYARSSDQGARAGLCEILFLLEPAPPPNDTPPPFTFTPSDPPERSRSPAADLELTTFHLIFVLKERSGRTNLSLIYNAALFDENDIRSLLGSYVALLQAMAAQPHWPLVELISATGGAVGRHEQKNGVPPATPV
jgi:hypothetical protein